MVERLRLEHVGTATFVDTFYELLADSRRRNVLQYLVTSRDTVSVREMATELAATEDGHSPADISPDRTQEVELTLTHIHLPLLADTGVITWDRDGERVALTPLLDHVSLSVPSSGSPLELSLTAHQNPS